MGTGINKIRTLLKEAGAPPPQFEFGNFYTIIFPRTVVKTSEKTSEKILRAIADNSHITIAELTTITGVTPRSVERNIQKLQEQGLLKRIGPAKGGYWEVRDSE